MKRLILFLFLGMVLFSSFVVSSDYFGVGRFNGWDEDKAHIYFPNGGVYRNFGSDWGLYAYNASHIDFGDFYGGDGIDDVVALVNEDGEWYIYNLDMGAEILNNKNAGRKAERVVFGDIDGDGYDEIGLGGYGVAIHDRDGSLLYSFGTGAGQGVDIDFGDVDGDDDDEIGVAIGPSGGAKWKVYDLIDGNPNPEMIMYGSFGGYDSGNDPANPGPIVAEAREIAFGDFDGDQIDEFVVVPNTMYTNYDMRSCFFYKYELGQDPETTEFLDIPVDCAREGYCYVGGYEDCKREAEYVAFGDFDEDGYDDFGFIQYEYRLIGEEWVFHDDFLNVTSLKDCLGQSECEALSWAYSGHSSYPNFNDIDFGVLNGRRVFGASAEDPGGVYAWRVYDKDNYGSNYYLEGPSWGAGYDAWTFAFAKAPGDEIIPTGTHCVNNYLGECCALTCEGEVYGDATGCNVGEVCCEANQCTEELPPGCELSNVIWANHVGDINLNGETVDEGELVRLAVQGNAECNGQTVTFEFFEKDLLGMDSVDGDIFNHPPSAVISGQNAFVFWYTEWHFDEGFLQDDDPEYVFKAKIGSSEWESGELEVVTDNVYLACEGDECIKKDGTEENQNGCTYVTESCGEGSIDCGNGDKDAGEDCDCGDPWICDDGEGYDFGSDTCESVWGPPYINGELSCYDPDEDLDDRCTFGIGTCQDDENNPPVIPDEGTNTYTVTGECVCDPEGDGENPIADCPEGIGTRNIIVYQENGDSTEYDRECFLVTEDVPFMSMFSFFVVTLILFMFYSNRKK